ncbi:hypothetical protein SprV_0702310300 [Sparganum proliferum]
MVLQFHDGMMARVTGNGAVSEAFAVTNGVKQGCVLAPTLFNLMFSAMLMDACRDERPGIRVVHRTEGYLLNHRRMHFQSRVSLRQPLRPQRHLGRGHAKEHGPLRLRLRQLRSGHQHGKNQIADRILGDVANHLHSELVSVKPLRPTRSGF